MNSTISICIPTFNGEKYLSRALECCINQDYFDYEILVIDDCSTDSTIQIVKNFQEQYPLIRLIINRENLGLVGNWNKCIHEAKGEWIKFLFQDDLMDINCLTKMYNAAKKNNCNLIISARNLIIENSALLDIKNYYINGYKSLENYIHESKVVKPEEILNLFYKNFLENNFFGEPILGLFHKSIFGKYGFFDMRLKQFVDMEFYLRICLNEPFYYLNEKVNSFRIHGDSETSKNIKQQIIGYDSIFLIHKIISDKFYNSFRDFIIKQNSKHNFYDFYIQDVFRWNPKISKDIKNIKELQNYKPSFKTRLFWFADKVFNMKSN